MAGIKRKSAENGVEAPKKKIRSPSEKAPRGLGRPQVEPAFVRGGGDALTPIERRKIAAKAAQDILFEESGIGGAPADASDSEGFEGLKEPPQPKKSLKAKSRRADKSKPSDEGGSLDRTPVVCEGLTSKKLAPGTKVFGQICEVHKTELVLSLPNNLGGYVPITAISEGINQSIQHLVVDGDDEQTKREQFNEDVDLRAMFELGQYLRATVIPNKSAGALGAARKRPVTLSINPRIANQGLLESEIAVNATIQTEVLSIEDHGIVVGLGLDQSSLQGFISSKELPGRDPERFRIGSVMLCIVTGLGSNGRILKLSPDQHKIGNVSGGSFVKSAPGIGVLLPGTAVDFLVTGLTMSGVVGKALGLVDIMADVVHSGAWQHGNDLSERYPIGSRQKGRLTWASDANDHSQVGVSLLDHVLQLNSATATNATGKLPRLDFKIGEIIDNAKVTAVQPKLGLFVEIGSTSAFVHISRVSDEKIEALSESAGPYAIGTSHHCRLLGYNYMDNLYIASLAPKTLELPFLRLEDLSDGDHVRGTVEKLIDTPEGTGALVKLTDTISGFVTAVHLSDVLLNNPERKFRPGTSVAARVLSIDLEHRSLRLTLKKTLVNSESPVWKSYDGLSIGASAPGTLIKFVSGGAVVQFFGKVQGYLPQSEMSEAYIEDAEKHFRLGQVLTVQVLSLDSAKHKLALTCREVKTLTSEQQQALEDLNVGSRVKGKIIEKTRAEILLEVGPAGLMAILPGEHLLDGSETAVQEAMQSLHIGQGMKQLMILKKDLIRGRLELTKKPSLIKASTSGRLPSRFEDLAIGLPVDGYVNNTTDVGVFVSFLGGLTALLPPVNLAKEIRHLPSFGFRKHQSITAYVSRLDGDSRRFVISQTKPSPGSSAGPTAGKRVVLNPIDGVTSSLSEFSIGKLTRAKVTAIKATQLNVRLADGVPGRIDVSELFNSSKEIENLKHPLKQFSVDQEIEVRILGTHDAKTHRFLPISHFGLANVYELSAKSTDSGPDVSAPTSIVDVQPGSKWLCFVHTVAEDGLFVNISPSVRGRIPITELSDSIAMLSDLEEHFPVGSAIHATVTRVDTAGDKLDLSAKQDGKAGPVRISKLSLGSILPALVTKVSAESVIVKLSEDTFAPIHRVDLADNYADASSEAYRKGQVVRVCVLKTDLVTNTIRLSARPSRVLSSASHVTDREILDIQDLKVNDVVRGFVKSIIPNGLFVTVAPGLNVFVKVAELSDAFIKDWSAGFESNQLVRGKIIGVELGLKRVQMSLKESALSKDYKPLKNIHDMHVGDLVSGKIRKVEDFGVFVVFDHSANVSGLCHRSQLADEKVLKPQGLYEEGDSVRAVIIKIDLAQRRISLSMKGSRIEAASSNILETSDDEMDVDGGVPLLEGSKAPEDDTKDAPSHLHRQLEDSVERPYAPPRGQIQSYGAGLLGGGFSWSAPVLDDIDSDHGSDSDLEHQPSKKPKRQKREPVVDRTGDLDANGPRTTADFERLLLGQPNQSFLWVQYMAFELQQDEIDKARAVAERAVRAINHQTPETEHEAMNAWVAYLNLENAYGTEESLEAIFERACEFNDLQEMHSKLASVYIQSQKIEKADGVLQKMIKKFSADPKVWQNYAAFLFDVRGSPDRARDLLPKALQSLPAYHHVDITSKFAQLEFRSPNGQAERGRTIFEGLFSNFPKRLDLWNVLLDLEIKASDREQVRKVFERITSRKLKSSKAHKFFKKWMAYEEKHGDQKAREKVEAKAAEYVKKQRQSQ